MQAQVQLHVREWRPAFELVVRGRRWSRSLSSAVFQGGPRADAVEAEGGPAALSNAFGAQLLRTRLLESLNTS